MLLGSIDQSSPYTHMSSFGNRPLHQQQQPRQHQQSSSLPPLPFPPLSPLSSHHHIPPLQLLQQPTRLQQQHNLMHRRPNIRLLNIDNQIRLLAHRRLILVIHARKALDLALPRARIHALAIRLLAVLERRRNVHEEERPELLDGLSCGLPTSFDGRNWRRNHRSACFRELPGDEGDARDILRSITPCKPKLGGQLAADGLAEEEGDGAPALLIQRHVEGARDGVFAAVVVAG